MQLNLALNTWGGKRRGAGRPASRYRSSELHVARERFDRLTPFHVTLRAVDDVRGLRTAGVYHAVRGALETANRREGFGIVHASIQDNHLHVISESTTDLVLSRGMQAFQISAARRINRASDAAASCSTTAITRSPYRALPMARPRTWLIAVGWKRAGDISVHAVPGGARP